MGTNLSWGPTFHGDEQNLLARKICLPGGFRGGDHADGPDSTRRDITPRRFTGTWRLIYGDEQNLLARKFACREDSGIGSMGHTVMTGQYGSAWWKIGQ